LENKWPIALVLIITLITTSIPITTSNENTPKVSVEPEQTLIGKPKNFTIDIDITKANNTWAWQFNVTWDPSLLNLTGITEGTFLSQGIYNTSLAYGVAITVNYTEGWALVGNTLFDPASPANGNGTLATLNFTVLETETSRSCPLNLYDTTLLLENLTAYTHETSNGTFYLLIGDTNEDWIVNATDLSLLNNAYGSYPGKSNWNETCDLNDDGIIEVIDLYKLSKNYGKEW